MEAHVRFFLVGAALAAACASPVTEIPPSWPAPAAHCSLAERLGTLSIDEGVVGSGVEVRNGGAVQLSLLVGDAGADRLRLELYPGQGTLGALRPGSYRIDGPETDYRTCSVCAYVDAGLHRDAPSPFLIPTADYYARSGRLDVHESDGRLRAELRDVLLTTDDGACASRLDALEIDVGYVTRR